MNHHLQLYFNSLKLKKDFFKSWAVDAITLVICLSLIFGFALVLQSKSANISAGKSLPELQQALTSGTLENTEEFLAQLQGLLALLIVGTILTVVAVFLLFSFSRCWI